MEISAAVLNEYSFAFCYLKCKFRVMSCCMDFALKPSGVVNWLNPCLTLRIKSALNFIAVYTIYFSEDKFLPAFHKWGTLHGIFLRPGGHRVLVRLGFVVSLIRNLEVV